MTFSLLKKYGIALLLYVVFLAFLYLARLFETWLTPINFLIYFLSFVLICENYKKSEFNRTLIALFKIFYFYTSIILLIASAFRILGIRKLNFVTYTYSDIGISVILLWLTLYLLLKSFNLKIKSKNSLMVIALFLSLIIILINYSKFLFYSDLISGIKEWATYAEKNYIIKLIIISALSVFWYRYYQKYFVLSEYLNTIIFLFMLSNILEGLHYVAFQHKFQLFVYSQYLALSFNVLFMIVWYLRLVYLNKDISKKNEKYLANFQYLGALVSKPKHSRWQRMVARLPINKVSLVVILIVGTIFFLYFVRFINLYLMLNTIFIVVLTFFAIFFSFSSIKRNWNQQMGFIFKGRKKKA